jgi:hypothetical protein
VGETLRINQYAGGSFSTLATAPLPFTLQANSWYRVLLRREGVILRAKMWPDGEVEPEGWQVIASSSSLSGGRAGVGHITAGAVNDWAFIGVGTGGASAPRGGGIFQ